MTKNNGFKVAALAASIALAMGATSAMAADPAAGALPGQGKVTGAAAVTFDNTAHTMGIALTGNAVINWGAGTGVENATTNVNSTGTAGFNIGKGATVTFSGAFGALNVDNTGNPSQIFGTLAGGDSKVFVANTNGIIVGATGNITASTGSVNLVANTLIDSATDFQANGTLTNFQGAGGDVTVLKGAQSTGTLLISGGGTVNVDIAALDGANTTINAGVKGGTLVGTSDNKSASVTITGDGTLGALGSAGTATTTGTLTLNANNVSGVLTNSGNLTLPAANGGVVNNGTLGESAAAGYTSLTNNGTYTAAGNTTVTGGDLVNNGIYDAGTSGITVVGGSFSNNATVNDAGVILVTNGTVTNSGTLAGVTSLDTASDAAAKNFAADGQYYIVNAGTISSDASGTLTIGTNVTRAGTTNKTTGSFTNTGVLQLDTTDALSIAAYNNLTLGGSLQVGTSPTFKAVSLTNPVSGSVTLTAGGYDSGTDSFAAAGALTVATPVIFAGGSLNAAGPQVKFMDNVTGVTSKTDKTPAGSITVVAGPALTDDYAVRVAAGKTVSANGVYVVGDTDGDDHPNVILQGTVSGNDVEFGWSSANGYQAISDLFNGAAGGIAGTGTNPYVEIDFTGAVKVAKYLNNANNFRYNYLPITNAGTGTLELALNPFAYNTNGTSNGLSAVNVLVDGDVSLDAPYFTGAGAPAPTVVNGTGTGVTGVLNVPNTHLVLQSTGNIEVGGGGAFYWPGYVYLGTIDSNADGSPAPGTLSADNAITLDGDFSNVLPGDVAGASGIHFMSAKALVATGAVTTNANAWINFPTDLLTQNYTQGILTAPTFSAGTATGLVVNYAPFTVGQTEKLFNTHPVDASK